MDKFNELLSQYKIPLALSLMGVVLILGGIFSSGLGSKPQSYSKTSPLKVSGVSYIKVDVSGAVHNPAVYSLQSGSRVEDAIKMAGGFTEDANSSFISKTLNLSQKIIDGQKIYVPFQGEEVGGVSGDSSESSGKIDLNSASESQLESLPGVGPATAQKIISNRPYSSLNDLTAKKVLSKSVLTKIQPSVEVN